MGLLSRWRHRSRKQLKLKINRLTAKLLQILSSISSTPCKTDGPCGISKTTRAKAGQRTCVSFPSLTQWRTFGHYTTTYSNQANLALAAIIVYLRMGSNRCGRTTGTSWGVDG